MTLHCARAGNDNRLVSHLSQPSTTCRLSGRETPLLLPGSGSADYLQCGFDLTNFWDLLPGVSSESITQKT